ncbi:tol-pal system protein YbgF [Nitratidesulfovibrio vulgaris]|jgi:tol-pal system protein YbgF|uniref:TPR domain protein n=2 Tax=Nitratidesulfovibrio vulgaris TaxID=881 RepID=Q72AR2_NITV2|nr:tol-pal system protein YbgF [Nitratidesulfovibrio vulgaris]GEB80827.1 tol-pal system protein YbgF [Desulfovibrio desulfuricans]HBW15500.1 tol-pal system protein YbgF [Desulfovibrio sp.]AAS96406.1 TPR domain protein [Nitratidesulfovibrio vulgaris str. Hildenborough]ABM28257.1 Tetratricopeptide TPR_2 repeat protein [Nitratidesulfovibrio vulgaris DP4]ADP86536.1 tol-pal system protein YbgF [Nitratidesulfovibrio vulgaris RCH1]
MKKHLATGIILPVCAVTALTACVRQGDFDALQSRVLRQEQQQQQLNMQLSGVQPAQADTWSQVQSMRQELATMRGQIDDMRYKLDSFGKSGDVAAMRDQLSKHDAALRQIASQFDVELKLDQPQADAAGALAPSTEPGHDGASRFVVAAETKTSGPVTVPPTQSGTLAVSNGTPAQQPAAAKPAAPAADTATALYDTGISSFNSRNYKDALKSFKDFTDTFPNHKLTSNAWFWQGETNFQMNNFPAAALAYEQVISKFPKSSKLPSALLKQGICFYKTGKKDAGKIRLEELIKKHPDSPEAKRAQQYIKDNK